MKIFQNVRGSQQTVPQIEINVDTVYVRSNIERIETDDFTGWEYEEVQYDKDEYIEKISTQNDTMLIDLDFRLTMMEMGL